MSMSLTLSLILLSSVLGGGGRDLLHASSRVGTCTSHLCAVGAGVALAGGAVRFLSLVVSRVLSGRLGARSQPQRARGP